MSESVSREEPGHALARVRHVALDLDGTLYKGSTLFPFTLQFLEELNGLGIGRTFITNNSSRSVHAYRDHLARFGIRADRGEILISTEAAIHALRERYPEVHRLFVIGAPGMIEDLTEAGFDCGSSAPEAVLAGFDPNLDFERLCKGAWWIRKGLPFIATHPDRICPTDEDTVLIDCGAVCAALREATGRAPDFIAGKPEPHLLQLVMKRHGLAPEQLAMTGDRIYTDMAMARRAGALAVLTLTGDTTEAEARAARPAPDLIVPDVRAFGEMLAEAREVRP